MSVEQPPVLLATSPMPSYPVGEVSAGKRGRVVARLSVNPDGTVDSTSVQLVSSDDPAFSRAVQAVVPSLRFQAGRVAQLECAMRDGQPVIKNGSPDCRGQPQPTGQAVRATVTKQFDFAP